MRLLPTLALLLAATVPAARAAEAEQACSAKVFAMLGKTLKVARFTPGGRMAGGDGVVVASACKPLPEDPRVTLAAAAWDAGDESSRELVVAELDEAGGTIVALHHGQIDEDASTHVDDGALRLDTAAYDLAPGVRAFGLDLVSESRACGEGGEGPSRSLYVRQGREIKPVLQGLAITSWWYLRGNEPRCTGPQPTEQPLVEDYRVTIALGAPGRGGWRDLQLTATSTRSDHRPGRKPLHVRVPHEGDGYSLTAFDKAFQQWKQ